MCSLVEGGGQFFTKTSILKTRCYMIMMIMIRMIMMSALASFSTSSTEMCQDINPDP